MDVRNIYEVWAGDSGISLEVMQMRSSEDGVVREGFRFFFSGCERVTIGSDPINIDAPDF